MKKLFLMVAALGVMSAGTKALAQTQQRDTSRKDSTKAATTTPAPAAPTSDVATLIASSADYSTLNAAIKAAGLDQVLKGGGPYTIFAPNDAGFSKVPKPKLDSLLKDQAALAVVLKDHIVNGSYNKTDIIKALQAGKGKATLKNMNGGDLTLSVSNKMLQITDPAGNVTLVSTFDMLGTNGVIHGVNTPLLKP